MIAKIVSAVLTWLLKYAVLPVLYFFYDTYKLRKENIQLKQNVEELKNAKTKSDIDSAIDKLN